jgi:hypothetical protein
MPLYALQIWTEDTDEAWARVTPEQGKEIMDAYNAFTKDIRDRGIYRAGEALERANTAKTVRVQDGKTMVTDGPFAETKEQLGGFYVVECDDMDQAVEVAARIPGAQVGAIEVRKVLDLPPEYQSEG